MTMTELTAFEGRDVLQTTLRVTKTGDGLSDSMKIAPQVWHVGDRVTVIIDGIVGKVVHEPIKVKGKTEPLEELVRVHVLAAETALPVERKVVQKVLDAHRKALDEARGQGTLELDD